MKTVVVAVGRTRPPFADDIAHYERLLAGYAKLEQIEVREDQRVERRIPDRAFVSLLAVDGETLDSEGFSRFIAQRRLSGRDLWFVIGGPFGLELGRADHRFSLGALTLPHQLARVVLLEQLFRAHKILRREPYHH